MRRIVSAACGLWVLAAGMAFAQSQQGVVVELYTSQGCSSCPPADEFLSTLLANPDVIALSLHVDYWDYIGWKDAFAMPKFTDRQKSYARAAGSRTVYTPQMIVGGAERVEGNQPAEVTGLLRKHNAAGSDVSLVLDRQGDRLMIRAVADAPFARGARVQLVRYLPSETVSIERGENAGRTVTYHNIVTDWQVIGTWDGETPLELASTVKGSQPVVVIVQAEGPSEILAAARLK